MNTTVYDHACTAVAEARSVVDEAGADRKAALRAYARMAMNLQPEIDAAEIRLRGSRRLGELIGDKPPPSIVRDAGIDDKTARQARALAAMSDAAFEAVIGEWRDQVARLHERAVHRVLRRREKRAR